MSRFWDPRLGVWMNQLLPGDLLPLTDRDPGQAIDVVRRLLELGGVLVDRLEVLEPIERPEVHPACHAPTLARRLRRSRAR